MKIEQLKYIVEISHSGSISTTAEKLHISQPTVSQSIASLEEELQLKIFKRSRLGAYPTESGKVIIEKAKEILSKVEELENAVHTQQSLLEANLSIVTIPSMCMTLLPKALGRFKSMFPKVQVEIIEAGSLHAIDYLENDRVDLGLVSRRMVSDFSSKYQFEPLLVGKVMACVNRKHPFAEKTSISIKDILNYPIVILNQEYRMHSYILNLIRTAGEPNILMTAGNPESLKRVIVEGLAIGFYSDVVLKTDPFVHNGDIIPLDIIEQNMNTFFGIINKKNNHLSPASKEFIKEIKKQARTYERTFNL